MNLPVLIGLIASIMVGNYSIVDQLNKPVIAVMDFEAVGIPDEAVISVSDCAREELDKTGECSVIGKTVVEAKLKELGFDGISCNSEKCAVKIGKLIKSEIIITGGVEKDSGIYTMSIRAVDVGSERLFLTGFDKKDAPDKFREAIALFISDLISGKTDITIQLQMNDKKLLNDLKRERKSSSFNYVIGAGMLLTGAGFAVASPVDRALLVPSGICSAIGIYAVLRTISDRKKVDREIEDCRKRMLLNMDIDLSRGRVALLYNLPIRWHTVGRE